MRSLRSSVPFISLFLNMENMSLRFLTSSMILLAIMFFIATFESLRPLMIAFGVSPMEMNSLPVCMASDVTASDSSRMDMPLNSDLMFAVSNTVSTGTVPRTRTNSLMTLVFLYAGPSPFLISPHTFIEISMLKPSGVSLLAHSPHILAASLRFSMNALKNASACSEVFSFETLTFVSEIVLAITHDLSAESMEFSTLDPCDVSLRQDTIIWVYLSGSEKWPNLFSNVSMMSVYVGTALPSYPMTPN